MHLLRSFAIFVAMMAPILVMNAELLHLADFWAIALAAVISAGAEQLLIKWIDGTDSFKLKYTFVWGVCLAGAGVAVGAAFAWLLADVLGLTGSDVERQFMPSMKYGREGFLAGGAAVFGVRGLLLGAVIGGVYDLYRHLQSSLRLEANR